MVVQLGVQSSFGERLLEPVQQIAIGQGGSGIRPTQQLVQQLIWDLGLFASRQAMAPSAASDRCLSCVDMTGLQQLGRKAPLLHCRVQPL